VETAGHVFKIELGSKANVLNVSGMTRQEVLDLYFMDARCKLIDLAAFMDRVERAEGTNDFRFDAFRQALKELEKGKADRAKRVLLSFSDPTSEPILAATTKAACGAYPERTTKTSR
jgi:hypothetical protein